MLTVKSRQGETDPRESSRSAGGAEPSGRDGVLVNGAGDLRGRVTGCCLTEKRSDSEAGAEQ